MKLPTLPLLLNTPHTESAGRQIRGAIQVSLFLLLAAVPRAASATGYWKVSFKVEGHYQKNKKSDDKDVPISSATPFRDVWNNSATAYAHPDDFMILPAPGGGYGGGANSGGLSFYLNDYGFQSVTTNMSGALRVTPILKWIEITDPNDTPELPPTKILLKVSSLAEAVGVGDGLPAVATSSNGFGDPSIPEGARTVSSGYKFVVAQVPSNGVVTLNTIDLSAKLAGTVGWYLTPVYPNISLRVSVEVDQRKVWITSPTIEDSFYKSNDVAPPGTPPGVLGPFPPSRQPHKRERDLSMVVDSMARWEDSFSEWFGDGEFVASTPNFASPHFTWRMNDHTLTPEEHLWSSPYLHFGHVPHFSLLTLPLGGSSNGTGMARQLAIKLQVRDSDDVLFPASYTVKYHLPAEWNSTPYRVDPPVWDAFEPVETGTYVSTDKNGIIDGKFRWDNFYIGAIAQGGQAVWGVLSSVPDARGALLFNMVGVVWSKTVTDDVEMQTAVFNDCWDDPDNLVGGGATWDVPPADDSVDERGKYHFTNIRRMVQYEAKYYTGDSYDNNGYVGPIRRGIKVATGKRNVTGDFIRNAAGGQGGE